MNPPEEQARGDPTTKMDGAKKDILPLPLPQPKPCTTDQEEGGNNGPEETNSTTKIEYTNKDKDAFPLPPPRPKVWTKQDQKETGASSAEQQLIDPSTNKAADSKKDHFPMPLPRPKAETVQDSKEKGKKDENTTKSDNDAKDAGQAMESDKITIKKEKESLPKGDNEKPEPVVSATITGPPRKSGYQPPSWATEPRFEVKFEVLKGGIIIETVDLTTKSYYIFGRHEGMVDFVLKHPSISRMHAAVVHGEKGVFLMDLGSTHGTAVGKQKIKEKEFRLMRKGDVIKFGSSSRLYIFDGPDEMMAPEYESEALKQKRELVNAKREQREQRKKEFEEKKEQMQVSWGFDEDAVEEEGNDSDSDEEDLPEYLKKDQNRKKYKEQKSVVKQSEVNKKDMELFEKLQKKVQKVNNLQREIQRILAKEGGQAGLTQGQQDAITRNEKVVSKLKEEIDEIEDTIHSKNKQRANTKEENSAKTKKKEKETYDSEDDDFYDRTKNQKSDVPRKRRGLRGFVTSKTKDSGRKPEVIVDTLESLLEKQAIKKAEIEALEKSLCEAPLPSSCDSTENEAQKTVPLDPLDAFMVENKKKSTTESKKVNLEKIKQIKKELGELEVLIKISQPALKGLASCKSSSQLDGVKTTSNGKITPLSSNKKEAVHKGNAMKGVKEEDKTSEGPKKKTLPSISTSIPDEVKVKPTVSDDVRNNNEKLFDDKKNHEATKKAERVILQFYGNDGNTLAHEKDDISEEKDNKITGEVKTQESSTLKSGKRKRQQRKVTEKNGNKHAQVEVEAPAMKGPQKPAELEESPPLNRNAVHSGKQKKLKTHPEKELEGGDIDWVPPKNQTGDGKTHLNEKFGY